VESVAVTSPWRFSSTCGPRWLIVPLLPVEVQAGEAELGNRCRIGQLTGCFGLAREDGDVSCGEVHNLHQLVHVGVLAGQPAPQDVIRTHHDLDAHSRQIGMEIPGRQGTWPGPVPR
jgi:hypothetical protein